MLKVALLLGIAGIASRGQAQVRRVTSRASGRGTDHATWSLATTPGRSCSVPLRRAVQWQPVPERVTDPAASS